MRIFSDSLPIQLYALSADSIETIFTDFFIRSAAVNRKKTLCIIYVLSALLAHRGFAAGFFSGYTGIKADLGFANAGGSFDMQLKLQSFFAGQFNLANNLIARAEFSIRTDDIIDNTIFNKTPADFKIDELSLIYRKQFLDSVNFFSVFAGTYEPIGSDLFLRRQFGIEAISSKITESWLGLSGSIVCPLFGIGISDIVCFSSTPVASGGYLYVNRENPDNNFVLNVDARFACAYQYFILDAAAGINSPMKNKNGAGEDVLLLIDSLYAHAGITMLIGNNYTPCSLFMQAGVYDLPLEQGSDTFSFDIQSIYLLAEFRTHISSYQTMFAVFSLPSDTVSELLFIRDTLGCNLTICNPSVYIGAQRFEFGIHNTLSFKDKTYMDVQDFIDLFASVPTITASPYAAVKVGRGEFRTMLQVRISDLINNSPAAAFECSFGYKMQL